MVERKSKIAEVTNATTKQAAVFIVVYSWVIVRNIGKARAERDSYNKKLVHATQLLDSYKNTYGGGENK